MAGRYLAVEMQNESGDVIYPHTEADIVFTSEGRTVEEHMSGEITETDIQEILNGSQPEMSSKMSVKEKIKKAFWHYTNLFKMKVLDSVEEIEANTDDGYIMGARAGAEIINNLGGYSFGETADGKPGYRKPGADTVFPFSSGNFEFTVIQVTQLNTGNSKYADSLMEVKFIFENFRLKSKSTVRKLNGVGGNWSAVPVYIEVTNVKQL